MKVLCIILSSPDVNDVYKLHKDVWSLYMNEHPDVESFFIEYHTSKHLVIENNTLYVKGEESYSPGCREKTLDSMEFLLNRGVSYDYIIRTNMSSFWNYRALIKFLCKLPTTNVYAGFTGVHDGLLFVGGAGIIMSHDIAVLLLKNRELTKESNIIDDVDFAYALTKLGVSFIRTSRVDFYSEHMYNRYKYNDNVFYYRIKMHNLSERHMEPVIMRRLLQHVISS